MLYLGGLRLHTSSIIKAFFAPSTSLGSPSALPPSPSRRLQQRQQPVKCSTAATDRGRPTFPARSLAPFLPPFPSLLLHSFPHATKAAAAAVRSVHRLVCCRPRRRPSFRPRPSLLLSVAGEGGRKAICFTRSKYAAPVLGLGGKGTAKGNGNKGRKRRRGRS